MTSKQERDPKGAPAAAVLAELRRLVRASELSQRKIEERAGFSKGYLSQLLAENLDLKVWHLLAILEVLEVSPADFFLQLYPSRRYPALEEFQRLSRPLSEKTDRVLEGLYAFGVESLRDLRGRLERCETAIGQLHDKGLLGRDPEREAG